jgi:hypothetical protein
MRVVKMSTVTVTMAASDGRLPSRPMTEPDSPAAAGPPPTVVRLACLLLPVVGFGSVLISLPSLAKPENARCSLSRARIDDANTDTKPWNNVDTGGRKARKVPCADAIRLAGQVRLDQKGTRTASVPGEEAVRIQAGLAVVLGLGQGISAALVFRTLGRPARNAAVAFAALGIALPVLGIFSLGVAIFLVYALVISSAAKQLWPRGT